MELVKLALAGLGQKWLAQQTLVFCFVPTASSGWKPVAASDNHRLKYLHTNH